MLEADRLGYFQVEARIDGESVDFIIDTGASLVVLRETDAARVGIRPRPQGYTATAITANGKIKAARATIDCIELGGITVYEVPVMVLPDEALAKNPLGVSFLSRLRGYEYAIGHISPRAVGKTSSRPTACYADGALCCAAALGYWIPHPLRT